MSMWCLFQSLVTCKGRQKKKNVPFVRTYDMYVCMYVYRPDCYENHNRADTMKYGKRKRKRKEKKRMHKGEQNRMSSVSVFILNVINPPVCLP